jgi:hypothetical protein
MENQPRRVDSYIERREGGHALYSGNGAGLSWYIPAAANSQQQLEPHAIEVSNIASQHPSINENLICNAVKSKIAPPKDPQVFRRESANGERSHHVPQRKPMLVHLSSIFRHRPNVNEEGRSKSKIVTPKGPKAFRKDLKFRCAMKAGSLELGNL